MRQASTIASICYTKFLRVQARIVCDVSAFVDGGSFLLFGLVLVCAEKPVRSGLVQFWQLGRQMGRLLARCEAGQVFDIPGLCVYFLVGYTREEYNAIFMVFLTIYN